MNDLLIIIPAYNEGKNLIDLLKKIKSENENWNIIIVDDSENFETGKLIENYKEKRIYYIKRNLKMGRGNAVRFGFEYSKKNKFDYILEMDADLSHNPAEIKLLLKKLISKKYDLVIGSRYLKDSKIIGWPIKRRIFSKLSNFFARFLFGFGLTDYTNGFRVYNASAINELIKYPIENNGFMYLTETFTILKKKNYKICEQATIFINRKKGSSSLRLSEVLRSFIGIIKLKLKKL
ncbi:glycosyltransferase [Alphaproteobacteria bacterium]|nr:glycosyltransferase [Alphaproteobacteria bacterium]